MHADSSPGRRARRTSRRRGIRVVVLAMAAVALPFVAAVVVDVSADQASPLGDVALIDLHVRDLLSGHLPLIGVWSRFGWNHPGPALYYALAPFSLLANEAGWGTMIGGALLQALAVAGIAWLAWRRGGWTFSLAALVAVSLMYSTLAVSAVLVPWNPWVLFPFSFLFALAVWATVVGDPMQLVLVAVVGSFLVQTHIGYTPFVVAALVYLAVLVVVDVRRDALELKRLARAGAWALAVSVVMWLPPMIEQVTRSKGNLTRILDYFTNGADHAVGLTTGLETYAANWQLPPPWLAPAHQDAFLLHRASMGWLVLPAVLLVVGALAAWSNRCREDLRLVGIAACFVVAGGVAYTKLESPLFSYVVMWRAPVAVLVWFSAVWSIGRWAGRRWLRTANVAVRTAAALVSVGAVLWASGGLATRVFAHGHPVVAWDKSAVLLADESLQHERPSSVLVWQVGGGFNSTATGLIDELERRGVDARVDQHGTKAELYRRSGTKHDVQRVWYVIEEPQVQDYASRPGATVLAHITPLSPKKELELMHLQTWFLDKVRADNKLDALWMADWEGVNAERLGYRGADARRIRRLAALNLEVITADRCRCAVVSVDASTAQR
jgi:hypothetical protein